MNKPLFALGVSLLLLGIGMLYGVSVVAQEFDASVQFTARGQGYWIVTTDGLETSRHVTEREAYEAATNQWFITDGAEIQVIHNAVIDVEGFTQVTGLPEPEVIERIVEVVVEIPGPERIVEVPVIQEVIVEVPVEVIREVIVEVPVSTDGAPIMIPGIEQWLPVPDGLITKQFRVLNDDWAVASSNLFLYAYNVTVDDGSGWIVHRPAGWYRNDYVLSETTPLTEDQVVQLITAINGD